MEPIKINIKGPIGGMKSVNIVDMVETDDELLIKLSGIECYNIYSGQKLIFMRTLYSDNGTNSVISEVIEVLYEDEKHIIHTTKPENYKVPLYSGFDNIEVISGTTITENGGEEEYSYVIVNTIEDHNIFPQDLVNGLQEIYIKDSYGETLFTISGRNILIPTILSNSPSTSADCITLVSEDETCGKRFKKLNTYRYSFLNEKISRKSVMLSGLTIDTASDTAAVSNMSYIETKFNPFYYYYILTDDKGNPCEFDIHNEPIKHCVLYSDPWFTQYKSMNGNKGGDYYIGEKSSVSLLYDSAYWDTDIALSADINETKLSSEDKFNTTFIEDIEESLIPDIIDMERVKFIPVVFDSGATSREEYKRYYKWVSDNDYKYKTIYLDRWVDSNALDENGNIDIDTVYELKNNNFISITDCTFDYDAFVNNGSGCLYRDEYDSSTKELFTYTYIPTGEVFDSALTIATSITLDFHFRKRKEINTKDETIEKEERSKNSTHTSGNVYTDGWFIDEETAEETWWNGMDYSDTTITDNTMSNFIELSGCTSDLLGYLNFTDNDVFYRKKKVSETFVRLTFYNSTDPLEQKLLFYSTVYLDSTTLYGKYVRQLTYMNDNGLFTDVKNMNVAVISCSADTNSSRVDTKMVITNEFDRTKSAEGFNIYLFAKDQNINLENGEKTIYMKVEFNHAGNGKTIPMFMWPKDEDGKYVSLTTENFIKSLYIPIKLVYLNGRYSYYIPDAFKNENGNIELVLFEPKIDIIPNDGQIEETD